MSVVVVGGGKMGLPLACQFAHRGANVTVCDVNPALVDCVNRGISPFDEPGLQEILQQVVQSGHLRATLDTSDAVAEAQVVVVIVPVLLTTDRDADLSKLIAASEAIAKGLKPNTLVSFETTLPLGTCRKVLIPILEQYGRKAGRDLHVCFSPERVKSLNVFQALTVTPKIVGGFDVPSAARGAAFYRRYLGAKVLDVGNLEAAEMVKLAGMLYRDLNIALANELGEMCEEHDLSLYDIIAAANTDGETHMLKPGIGVGGHCTPVYPYFLITRAHASGKPVELVACGRKLNERQPARNVRRLAEALTSLRGKRVHVLGLAFRPGVKEHSFSPAFALRDELAQHGAIVTLEDPLYRPEELRDLGFYPARAGIDPMDAVMLNTGHAAFALPDFTRWRSRGIQVVLDGRGFWPEAAQQQMQRAGCRYLCVGQGNAPDVASSLRGAA